MTLPLYLPHFAVFFPCELTTHSISLQLLPCFKSQTLVRENRETYFSIISQTGCKVFSRCLLKYGIEAYFAAATRGAGPARPFCGRLGFQWGKGQSVTKSFCVLLTQTLKWSYSQISISDSKQCVFFWLFFCYGYFRKGQMDVFCAVAETHSSRLEYVLT